MSAKIRSSKAKAKITSDVVSPRSVFIFWPECHSSLIVKRVIIDMKKANTIKTVVSDAKRCALCMET